MKQSDNTLKNFIYRKDLQGLSKYMDEHRPIISHKVFNLLMQAGWVHIALERPHLLQISKQRVLWKIAKMDPWSDYIIEIILPLWRKVKLNESLLVLLLKKGRKTHKLLPFLHRFGVKHQATVFNLILQKASMDEAAMFLDVFHGLPITVARQFIVNGKIQETFAALTSFNKDSQTYILNHLKTQT